VGSAGRTHQLDSPYVGQGDTLPLELKLNSAAQFASDVVVTRGSGANLQPENGRVLIKRLQTENSGTIDERLRPSRIVTQLRGCGVQRLQSVILGHVRGDSDVDEGLGPVAAEITDRANVSVRKSHQSASRIAHHRAPKG